MEQNLSYEKWLGYGMQRNKAIDNASHEWVLNIDADEEISPALKEKIIKIKNGEIEGEVFSR